MTIREVGQSLAFSIKNEPSFVPVMEFFAHFRQSATARSGINSHIMNKGQLMTSSFNMMPEIQRLGLNWKISRQWALEQNDGIQK